MDIKDILKLIKDKKDTSIENSLFLRSIRFPAPFSQSGSLDASGIPIMTRPKTSPTDPNIKIATDYFNIITTEKSGYLAHNIVREYLEKDDTQREGIEDKYKNFDRLNYISNIRSELMMSTAGWGSTFTLYKILDGDVYVNEIPTWNSIIIYDQYTKKPIVGIIYNTLDDDKFKIWVYTETEVKTYMTTSKLNNTAELIETSIHGFTQIPLVEWKNNKHTLGNAEKVISLIDAYDLIMSDSATEQSALREAYLLLKDMGKVDEKFAAQMRKTGIFQGVGENADAKFIQKNLNPVFVEMILAKIEEAIYKHSRIVDTDKLTTLTDARKKQIDMIYMGMDNDCDITEKQWKQALEFEDRILKSYWTTLDIEPLADYDTYNIDYRFIRNKPRDELADLESMARAMVILPKYKQYMMALGISEKEARDLALESEEEMSSLLPEIDDNTE